MSRRRSFDSIQFAAASQGRVAAPVPVRTWVNDPNWRPGGAWVCRTAEGSFLAAVFVTGRELLAVANPDLSSLKSHSVPGVWPLNPIGLRNAKVAAEAFLASFDAERAQAEAA